MRGPNPALRDRRADEILRLNALDAAELQKQAGAHLRIVEDIHELHVHFAESIVELVRQGNAAGRPVAMILPWGPVGQYPILSRLLQKEPLSLRHCTLFFMDEYASSTGEPISHLHPLSFRGAAERWLGSLDAALQPLSGNIVFPSASNAATIDSRIRVLGGIDVCFGGVGVHGHIAFNEPEVGVSETGVRLVALNEFTRTINSIRAGVGGDLENFPRSAWTLGMRQCLGARRLELFCRSDRGLDWAKTVLRLAVLGEPGDDYPVTWIRDHPDHVVVTDRATANPVSVSLRDMQESPGRLCSS